MGGGGEVVRSACVRALWRVAPLVPCGTLGVKAGRCPLTQATCVLAVVHLAGSRRRCARPLVPAMPTVASHAEACAAALDAADPGGQRRLTQELEFVQVRSTPEGAERLAATFALRCAGRQGTIAAAPGSAMGGQHAGTGALSLACGRAAGRRSRVADVPTSVSSQTLCRPLAAGVPFVHPLAGAGAVPTGRCLHQLPALPDILAAARVRAARALPARALLPRAAAGATGRASTHSLARDTAEES